MRKLGLVLFLFLSTFGANQMFAQTSNTSSNVQETKTQSKIERLVSENTPEFIRKSVATSSEIMEELRLNAYASILAKENKTRAEIQLMDKALEPSDPLDELEEGRRKGPNPFDRPWKMIELFVLGLAGEVFGNKLIFYGLILLFLILILRYIFS